MLAITPSPNIRSYTLLTPPFSTHLLGLGLEWHTVQQINKGSFAATSSAKVHCPHHSRGAICHPTQIIAWLGIQGTIIPRNVTPYGRNMFDMRQGGGYKFQRERERDIYIWSVLGSSYLKQWLFYWGMYDTNAFVNCF